MLFQPLAESWPKLSRVAPALLACIGGRHESELQLLLAELSACYTSVLTASALHVAGCQDGTLPP